MDHQLKAQTKALPAKLLQPADSRKLVAQEEFRTKMLPEMLSAARAIADKASAKPRAAAADMASSFIGSQISRLKDLQTRNPNISSAELESLKRTLSDSLEAISASKVRLDSIRLIVRQ